MRRRLTGIVSLVCIAGGLAYAQQPAPAAPPKIAVLIITGQSNHNWRGTTPLLRKALEDTGKFDVRVTEEFRGAGPEALAPYDLVVLNYFDRGRPELRWGEKADSALLDFVRSGKGVVVYHFSVAAFDGWTEYEKLSGANWRPNNGHHSAPHNFVVDVKDQEHPITKGLKLSFPQANDELYANLRWQPAGSFHLLATANDDHALYAASRTDSRAPQPLTGASASEPMLWTVDYGKGRVFVTALGHDVEQVQTPAFVTTFARGAEWAATGKVTQPIPAAMAAAPQSAAQAPPPPTPEGYVPRGTRPAKGLAPGMKVIDLGKGGRTYRISMTKGDEIMSGLTDFAEKYHISNGHFTALGAINKGLFGWSDVERGLGQKKIELNQEAEIVSLMGSITTDSQGRANVHGHGTVALSDGSVKGGHWWEAHVSIIADVFVTEEEGASQSSIVTPAPAQLAPPNEAGVTFGHVHLNVRDIEVHKKLWVDHFGGVVVQKGPLVAVKLPGMLIAFRQAEPTGGSEGTVMDHFGFKVRNLAEVLQAWRAAGYKVGREFIGAEGFPNAYLFGPDDLKIEVQEDQALPVKASAYHLHFLLADYAKLRDWYVDTFSAVPRKRGTIATTADTPGMNLSFATSAMPTVATKGRTIDHIGFEITNLESFCKRLEARGMKFDVPFRNVPAIGLNIAYITDPSGVYIELTEGYNKY